jgi:MFS family permease
MLPPYIIERGGSEWHIGLVVGSFGTVSLLVRQLAGKWIYKLGPKTVAIIGSMIFATASSAFLIPLDTFTMIPIRIIQGIGMAMTPVATVTMVANLSPTNRRAEALSYHGNAVALSGLYAPLIGFWLIESYSYSLGFLYCAICSALSMCMALRISQARTTFMTSKDSKDNAPFIAKGAIFPTLIFISYTFTTAPVQTFLPILATERDLGNPGLFFTVHSIITIFAMLISGRAADRLGRSALIIPGLIFTSLGMFILMLSHNQFVFLLAALATGGGFGMIQPAMQSFTIDRVPRHHRSAALATLQSGWDIGGSGGSLLLGPVAGILTTASTFGIAGAGTVIGSLCFFMGPRNSKNITR